MRNQIRPRLYCGYMIDKLRSGECNQSLKLNMRHTYASVCFIKCLSARTCPYHTQQCVCERLCLCVCVFLWGVTAAAMTKNKTLRSRVATLKWTNWGTWGKRPAALISEYALSLFMTYNGKEKKKPPALAFDVIIEQMQIVCLCLK